MVNEFIIKSTAEPLLSFPIIQFLLTERQVAHLYTSPYDSNKSSN